MGKDTEGNRKSGRAGNQAPEQTPAVGVTPASKVLAYKDASSFATNFAQDR